MKNLVAVLFVLLSLSAFSQIPDYVPTEGLVGWYPLDGNAEDLGSQTINGSVLGPTSTIDRWGNTEGAMHFDELGDRIELGEISSTIGTPNSGMTLSCWFKGEAIPTSGQSTGQIVSAYYGAGNRQIRLEVVHAISNGPGHHLKYYWRCPEENDEPVSAEEFSTSDWNHYVMVVDPSMSEVRIFLNGVVVQDMTAPYSPSNDYFGQASRNWMIGSYHPQINQVPHQFFGDVDEVGIWDRALTDEEILVLFESPNPAIVEGCMDDTACNYNPEATEDDGSCINANIVVDDSQLCETGVVAMSVFQNVLEGEPRSLSFSQGQYVRIPMSPSLSNFTDYTMEFWYYETGGHGSDEMIVGTEFFSGNRYGIYSFVDGYWPYIRDNSTFLGLGYNGSNPNAGISYNMNEWNHIAITYDGSTFRFFVNGQLSYSESGTVSGFGPLTEDLVINRHTWNSGSSSRLAGQLDELRISDIARYTSNFSPPEYEFQNDLNTKGLWHFNEGSGGAVYDASPFGNHGNCLGTGWSENTPITQSLTEGYEVFWNGGEESTPAYDASPGETVEVVLVGELGSCSEVINIESYSLDEGCADEDACNYSETAACNLGCVYPVLGASDCDEGSVTCGPGTVWDAENQTCVVATPAYLNEPGAVSYTHLTLPTKA